MKTETIKDGKKLLAVILRSNTFPEGLTFYTSEKDFIQLFTWNHDNWRIKRERREGDKILADNFPNHYWKIN